MTAAEVEDLLNQQSGLRGLMVGGSSDFRDITAAAADGDERAKLALEIFCYRVVKYIGAYAAVLEGLDAIVGPSHEAWPCRLFFFANGKMRAWSKDKGNSHVILTSITDFSSVP